MNDNIIDWQLADVYTYALVVASIWSRKPVYYIEKLESSCFLETYLPRLLSQSERSRRLIIMKTQTDGHHLSVINQSLTQLEPSINPLLRMCLSAIASKRARLSTLIPLLIHPMCAKISRDPEDDMLEEDDASEQEWRTTMFKVR